MEVRTRKKGKIKILRVEKSSAYHLQMIFVEWDNRGDIRVLSGQIPSKRHKGDNPSNQLGDQLILGRFVRDRPSYY